MVDTRKKKMVLVVMGASGAGKSRLAVDIAGTKEEFEIVNADSMQVYRGLDVLTNKIPFHQRNGVPHHLLGTIDPTVSQFTSRQFRDLAIPIIDDILARGRVPIIVGGTNYYIQALVSPFLIDDLLDDECCPSGTKDLFLRVSQVDQHSTDFSTDYHLLKELDPLAANRIHPNDCRKVAHYLNLYASSGILPSELLRGKTSGKWGQPGNFRYDCCFIWVDASLPVIDRFVDERVDCMIEGGLLDEVFDIYNPAADYTRGLRQAIGVREFEVFCNNYLVNSTINYNLKSGGSVLTTDVRKFIKGNCGESLDSDDNKQRVLLNEAIDKLKANTRRLVRRQKRRLNRLKTLFGWELHYFDATEALEGNSVNYWQMQVVKPCVSLVKAFLSNDGSYAKTPGRDITANYLDSRDLWTQYVCEACGGRILRGAHEWEQHKLGRGHKKRISALKRKSVCSRSADSQASINGSGYSLSDVSRI